MNICLRNAILSLCKAIINGSVVILYAAIAIINGADGIIYAVVAILNGADAIFSDADAIMSGAGAIERPQITLNYGDYVITGEFYNGTCL